MSRKKKENVYNIIEVSKYKYIYGSLEDTGTIYNNLRTALELILTNITKYEIFRELFKLKANRNKHFT